MCYPKPGPRCSSHASARLKNAVAVGNVADILEARDEFDETRKGQELLAEEIQKASSQKKKTADLIARKEAAAKRREEKLERYKSLVNQTASDTGSSAVTTIPEGGTSLEKAPLVPGRDEFGRRRISPEAVRLEAAKATDRYVKYVASLHDADPHEVERTIEELRMDYKLNFADRPENERPDPPQEWIDTLTNSRGAGVARLPLDAASRYAFYRAQYDPSVFADNPRRRYAILDTETAEEDFRGRPRPENGSIIEVGIVEYNAQGEEIDRYGQLIHPGEERAARIGTGAVEVHNITMDDVKDAPQWEEVVGEVRSRLEGRTIIAHNAPFDSAYLGHHVYGRRFLPQPVIDTLNVSRMNNADMDNHKLATVAERHGVVYDNGHRAVHDALVCAKVFFAMKRKMREDWDNSHCARVLAAR